MIRRIFAILLALCLLFSAVLSFADEFDDEDWDDDEFLEDDDSGFEEEEDKVDFRTIGGYGIETVAVGDFNFRTLEDGSGLVVTSYTGTEPDVVIPDSVEDAPVVEIDTAFCVCNPIIQTLTIPGSVKTVGTNAFAQCQNLKSVVIDEGVLTIGMCSFGGCLELESIQLPESLEVVSDFAFAKCILLHEITFGTELQSIGKQAFFQCEELSKACIPGGDAVTIGDQAFEGCAVAGRNLSSRCRIIHIFYTIITQYQSPVCLCVLRKSVYYIFVDSGRFFKITALFFFKSIQILKCRFD